MPTLARSLGRLDLPRISPRKIPHAKVKTWNPCSLSLHRTDPEGRLRKVRVLACMTRLLTGCDVLCIQEGRLGALDTSSLNHYFPNHLIYYENDIFGHGGAVTLVCRKFAKDYTIKQIKKEGAAYGRILSLVFTPIPHPSLLPPNTLCVTNVYLTSSADHDTRVREFLVLAQLDPTHRHIICGDFNFVETAEDAPSAYSAVALSASLTEEWEKVVRFLGLKEVYQPTHTRYAITHHLHSTSSSRLDRFYISHTEAELAVLTPTAYIPYMGVCAVASTSPPPSNTSKESCAPRLVKKFVSDHLPVSLEFQSTELPQKRNFSLPKWCGDIPDFAEKVRKRWVGPRSGEDPHISLARWKKACINSYKAFSKSQKVAEKVFGGVLGEISIGTYILRVSKTEKIDIPRLEALLSKAPSLRPLVDISPAGRVETTELELRLTELITDNAAALADDELESSFQDYIPGKSKRADPISRARSLLPSTRSRLTHLRARLEDDPTDDPHQMGDIASVYYGEVWKKNRSLPSHKEMCAYVAEKLSSVPPDLQPEKISADHFAEAIEGSNNSCTGPSGIPFSAYRSYLREDFQLAELGSAVVEQMGRGVLPPVGFNYGRFFMLPKDGSLTVEKTRGLSVTDCFNRLTATCMVKVLEPAFDFLIGGWQKGFVGGRVGTEHVHELTGQFYRKMTKQQQLHVLLLDIKRAFDSLSHAFIHATLETVGLDLWARLVIKGLLHLVRVIPQLAVATDHLIRIGRGVKQGCPLSPLLFVLCFECLLVGIAAIRRLDPYAFADDLAVATRSVTLILCALRLLVEFSAFSDLHANVQKTLIVSTLPPSRRTKRRLAEAGWGDIRLAIDAIYLGVLFGRWVTTVEVFRPALDKFIKRAAKFRPAIKRMSLNMRIVTFNVFLLPLLYYLAQFLIVPYNQVVVPVREICRKYIIPFGSGFSYVHLITTRGQGLGPHTPLRDLWSWNMALLGSPFPMEDSDDLPVPALGDWEWVNKWNGLDNTLEPAAHSAYAAWAFMYDYAPRSEHRGLCLNLAKLPGPAKERQRRSWIYKQLVDAGYRGMRSSPKKKTSVARRLAKMLETPPSVETDRMIAAHLRLTGQHITPARWNLHLRLAFRSLPFDKRRSQAKMQVDPRPTPGVSSPFPCFACGKEEDSALHLYTACRVVKRAREEVSKLTGVVLLHDARHVLLAFNPTSNPLLSITTLIFNYHVWTFRAFCRTLARPPPFKRGAQRLVNSTLAHMPGSVRRDSAGEKALQLALDPPEHAVCIFGDGSSLGNPGPSGAGFSLRGPGVPKERHSIALGLGDNNDGEMQAIRLGLLRAKALVHRFRRGAEGKVALLLFSDSLGCLGYLLKGWKTAVDRGLARATKAIYRACKKLFDVALIWVRGHSKIPGNEEADEDAKKGAKRARDSKLQRAAHTKSIGLDDPS